MGIRLTKMGLAVIAAMTALALSQFVCSQDSYYALALLGGLFVFIVTMANPRWAVYIMVAAVILSPEIKIGGAGSQDIVVRIEDLVLFFMVIATFARHLTYKEPLHALKTPLTKPMLYFSFVMLLSTLGGAVFHQVDLFKGLLFLGKYLEYFVIYFMIINYVEDARTARNLALLLLASCLVGGIYGFSQIGLVGRVAAPFDPGEANTFGMYIAMMISLMIGLITHTDKWRLKVVLVLGILLLIPPFVMTLSRSSYAAIFVIYLVHIILAPKKKPLIVLFFAIVILLLFWQPQTVAERIAATFKGYRPSVQVEVFGYTLDESFSLRWQSWMRTLSAWTETPFFGRGLTGFGFIDGQYFRNLIEIGLVGFFFFFLLLRAIGRFVYSAYKRIELPHMKGFTAGLLASFAGLLVHALSANTFMIVRIMEPFWIMLALVFIYVRLKDRDS